MQFKFSNYFVLFSLLVFPLKGRAQDEEEGSLEEETSQQAKPADQERPEVESEPSAAVEQNEEPAQEEPASEAPEQQAAPAVEAASPAVAEEEVPKLDVRGRRSYTPERMFGSYDLTIAMNRPRFTQIESVYEKFYGKPTDYFSIGVDWYPFDFYATMGFGLKAGVYSATGKTSANKKSSDDNDGSSVAINDSSNANLLMAPLQLLLKIEGSPFARKYVKLSAWAGYERIYWREKKSYSKDDTSKSGSTSTSTTASEPPPPFTVSGYKDGIVLGGAAHILLNFLDESSANSMNGTLGFGSVYLTPYYQIIKAREDAGLNFSRTEIGIGFTFETIR